MKAKRQVKKADDIGPRKYKSGNHRKYVREIPKVRDLLKATWLHVGV
jgi:hypothetical protein